MRADAVAFYVGVEFLILLNAALPPNVRAWLTEHLRGLADDPLAEHDGTGSAAPLYVCIPLGEAGRMYAAPLAVYHGEANGNGAHAQAQVG